QQLASKLGITVSTLQRHLQHLTNLNLIDKQKGQDTGYYRYRLIAS
ncbi:TPA: ArsR family transcriptional regulator, partial [Candidatus Poribacteria bacterium]|nr:ArsR family transcriptional regulator [Candidatus Poribacteria bacterium]